MFFHFPNGITGPLNGIPNRLFIKCLPIRAEILIVLQRAIPFLGIRSPLFHPDLITTIPQMSLPWFCALLSQQSHLFLICAVLTYNDSKINLHKNCRIPKNCQCKWLLISLSAPGTLAKSSLLPEKFLFYMGMIVSIVLPNVLRNVCFTWVWLYRLCCPVLYLHSVKIIFSRLQSFTEDFVIRRY